MYATWKETLYLTVYTFLIFIIVLIWPYYQGIRFIFPIIPFIIFFMIKGILFFYNKYNFNKKYLVAALSVCIVIISFNNLQEIIAYTKIDTNECYTPELKEIYKYISKNIPQNEIIGFIKPRALRLFTDRNSISIDMPHYEGSVAKYLLINKSDYTSTNANNKVIYQTKNYVLISKPYKIF
jgi:hypothetical protein